MQRLKICVGVAKALSYIHYNPGRDFSVIHCNIRSSKILLDDEWEPKLSHFELPLKNTVARRQHLLLTHDIVKNVFLDPKYKKAGGVTHKSDVYSLGVVLLEVLRGRNAVDDEELGEGLLSQLEKSHLDDMWKHLEHLKIKLNHIELATENFDKKYCIGSGGYGMVYKVQLEHFDNSISSLIDQENRCCDHMIFVYELASKGSLEDYYMGDGDKMTNLTWMQRLNICLDIAHGLNYIHTNTDQDKQKIIHRGIKSANILLGDN
ncbi:kinase-like domain, phloem protein 2-like protein [Tanacetum coccineum]